MNTKTFSSIYDRTFYKNSEHFYNRERFMERRLYRRLTGSCAFASSQHKFSLHK